MSAKDKVAVSDLPADITEAKVKTVFGPYGTLKGVKMMGTGKCILWLADASEAEWIVENLDGNCAEGLMEPIKCAYPTAGGAPAAGGAKPGGCAGGAAAAGCAGGGGGCNPRAQMMQRGGCGGCGGCGCGGCGGFGGCGGKGGCGPYGGCGGGGGGCGMMGMMGGGMMDMASIIKMAQQCQPGAGNFKGRSAAQQLCIKNLPPDCTDYDLYKLCAPFGALLPMGVKAMLNAEGQCTGTGWVDFQKEDEAAVACQNLHGFAGLMVKQKWDKPAPQAL